MITINFKWNVLPEIQEEVEDELKVLMRRLNVPCYIENTETGNSLTVNERCKYD